jgi:16S rRNA (uracil1498-N3)-methyltransferase
VGLRSTSLPRFFVEGAHDVGQVVTLSGADARKLTVVLRARSGTDVEICDSAGQTFAGRINALRPQVAVALLARTARPAEATLELVLAQGVPKGAKMDFVVEKATELGVRRIVPLLTERTQGDPGSARLERWRRLARTAAQQCGRTMIPEIARPVSIDDVVRAADADTRVLIPWELAERTPLRERLPEVLAGATRVVALIGPEGGFSHAEVARCSEAGGIPLSLGARILRTETAGIVLLSAVLYAAGEL